MFCLGCPLAFLSVLLENTQSLSEVHEKLLCEK